MVSGSTGRMKLKPEGETANRVGELEEPCSRKQVEQARDEELIRLAHTIAHDMRESTRVLVNFSELLCRRYEERLDSEGREFLGYISKAALGIDGFVKDLLNYSRHLRGSDNPPSTTDAEAVLHSVLLLSEKEIANQGAEVTHDLLPSVQSDHESLTEIFRQLISNGLLFRSPAPLRIHFSAIQGDRETTFVTRDNGIGIDPRYAQQIFDPFCRLNGRQYPGSGLGLAVCKRIVERQGGRIWLEPSSGAGSEFRFTLPN